MPADVQANLRHHCRGCTIIDSIRDAVRLIAATGATEAGRQSLKSRFHLCSPPKLSRKTGIVQDFSDWFTDAIESTPQLNYPYPVSAIIGRIATAPPKSVVLPTARTHSLVNGMDWMFKFRAPLLGRGLWANYLLVPSIRQPHLFAYAGQLCVFSSHNDTCGEKSYCNNTPS